MGTTVYFTLPAAEDEDDETPAAAPPGRPASA
jgi:hypothetical protein